MLQQSITSGSMALLEALFTHQITPLTIEQVTATDLHFLGLCRTLRWGSIELIVKDGNPVIGRLVNWDWKFS